MPIKSRLALSLASVAFFASFLIASWLPQERWAFAPLSLFAAFVLLLWTVRASLTPPHKPVQDLSSPLDFWILLHVFSFFISLSIGTAPGLYAQEVQQITAWISVYYMAVLIRRHPQAFRTVYFTLILTGTLIAVLGLWKVLGAHEGRWTRLDPFLMRWNFRSHVQFSGFLGMITALSVGAVLGTRDNRLKCIFAICAAVCAAVMIATQSRIGWAALPFSFAVGALLFSGRIRTKLALAGFTVLPITGVVWIFWSSMQHRIASMGGVWVDTDDPRFGVWSAALRMWMEHWAVGVGPGMGRFVIMSYRPEGFDRLPEHLYNHWLNIAASQGLLALPILAALTIIIVRQIVSRLRSNASEEDRLVAGAALALLIVGIHDLVDFNLEVGINAAIASILVAWIQPLPPSPAVVGRKADALFESNSVYAAFKKHWWVTGVSIVCLCVSLVIGLSDWCVWRSQQKNSDQKSLALSDRWQWTARAVRIFPWYAKARFRRAELLTEIALSGNRSSPNPVLWNSAVDAWKAYLALNPKDYEAHQLLAISLIGRNGGRTLPAALEEMDRIIRHRDGQKPQLAACVRYALEHSEPGDLLTVAWAERHIADAIKRHTDPESRWRLPGILYTFWREHLPQAEAVDKMRLFYATHDLPPDLFLFFLRTSNLWSYAAGFELERDRLQVSLSVSSEKLKELRRDRHEVVLAAEEPHWKVDAGGGAPQRIFYPISQSVLRGSEAGYLLISAHGNPCGGAQPYFRIDQEGEGGKVLGGVLISGSEKKDYLVPIRIKDLTGRAGVRITFVNADNGPPNPCIRTGDIDSASLIF